MNDDILAELESYSAAKEAEVQDEHAFRIERRPQWAKEQYPVTRVTGRVTSITYGLRNGQFPEYYLHIAEPTSVEGDYDGGEVVLTVEKAKQGSRLGTRQPQHWIVESAIEQGAHVDNLLDLQKYVLTYELDARKPFPNAERDKFCYVVTERLSEGEPTAAPAPTHSIADFPELTAAALAYLDGKTAADFTKGFMAYAGAEGIGSPADRLAFSSFVIRGAGEGGFIATMIAEGRVTVGADGYEVREAATA